MSFDISVLSGEFGGLLAGAWGAGAAMSYKFTKAIFGRQIGKLETSVAEIRDEQAAERIQCREDIARLSARVDALTDRLIAPSGIHKGVVE